MLTQTMMTPTKMKLRVRKKDAGAKSSRRLLAETSPDSKCPICLDRFNNVASLDRCLHRFCFRCIHEWSKNKAECPLCKQPFRSIFHSVKAENDFKEFVLAPVENGPAAAGAPPAGQTDNATPSGRVRRPRAARGGERRSRRHQNPAPSAPSPDVRLENLTEGTGETVDQVRGVHHMMLRLTNRRRSRGEVRSLRRLRDQDVVAFRRALYRTGVRVRTGGWDSGRQRDVSAAHLRRNPACLRRLLPWLQRELTVLYGSHGSLVSIVQHIIMSRITHYDMDDAAIRDELRPFLLARTDHFLHELVSFARSTLSIEAYDQQAVYECPAPSYEEDSGSDSSIIAISEDDDDSDEPDITEAVEERVPPVPVATGGESSLSQSGWDDETPGPSYSTLFPSPSQSQVEGSEPAGDVVQGHEASRTSGANGPHENEEEEECMIVGYVKPMAERTPELVQLSSDSSEDEQEAVATEAAAAATVPKAEASSSQAQAQLSSPEVYLRPLSPSSCLYPSASRSPQKASSRTHSGERDTERESHISRKEETGQRCFRDRSWSSSDSSVLSGSSGHSRSHRRSGSCSRHQEPLTRQESRKWSHQSSGQSPTVSIASDSSESSRSSSWEQPQSKDRQQPQKSDEERKHPGSVSTRERSSQSSICWDSPGHGREQKKTRKRKRREKERERSRSPLRDYSASHSRCRDSRRRRTRHENRLRTTSHSSSSSSSRSSSSSSSVDSRPERPCPEKPAGKRKYKTRHLERAAQRQSSRRSSRERERRDTHSSPAKKHHRGERERSRSPSVEIIFEKRAPDTSSHTHRWRRKRHKKNRREARVHNSPTIITIESDSDNNNKQDCVTEIINKTADCQQPEVTNSRIRYQGRVIKAANRKPGDQQINRTSEDRHLVDDQHFDTKVTTSTTDAQHCVSKTTEKKTSGQRRATVVVDRITDRQSHVTNSRTEDHCSAIEVLDTQNHVTKVSKTDHSPVVDVTDCAVDGQNSDVDVVDQLVKRLDHKSEALHSKVDSSTSTAVPGPSLESFSPVTPTERLLASPDSELNLENCVVDVVDRESLDHARQRTDSEQLERTEDISQDASVTTSTTPPSDTRLLETILQELEDILPEEVQGVEPRQDLAATDNGVEQAGDGIVPHRVQSSDPGRQRTDNCDSQRGAEPGPAV